MCILCVLFVYVHVRMRMSVYCVLGRACKRGAYVCVRVHVYARLCVYVLKRGSGFL